MYGNRQMNIHGRLEVCFREVGKEGQFKLRKHKEGAPDRRDARGVYVIVLSREESNREARREAFICAIGIGISATCATPSCQCLSQSLR